MKRKLRAAFIQSAVLLSFLVSGCKPDNLDFGVPAGELVSVQITPAGPALAPGTSLQLEAIGTFSDNTTRTITRSSEWTTADADVAVVSGAGLVSADSSSIGTVVITATAGDFSDSATVTVSPLDSIAVTPDTPVMAPGTGQQAKATGTLQNAAVQDLTNFVTWTSSDTSVAGIIGPGVISAGPEITGTATIAAAFGPVTGMTSINVVPASSIAVTPENISVSPGKVQQFSATAIFSGNEKQDITDFATWSSLPDEIFAVTEAGLGISVEPGSAIITAALGNKEASAFITVADPAPTALKIVPDTLEAETGTGLQFAVFAVFADGSIRDLTHEAIWNISDPQTASISNVPGSRGLVTPLVPGTVRITANCFGIISPAAVLTVLPSPVFAPVVVTPANPVIRWGSSLQLTALSFFGDDKFPRNVTSSATWTSSDESVVFVAQGFATALRPGFATVTATFGNVSASTLLTVTSF